jgi:hypothetical protein
MNFCHIATTMSSGMLDLTPLQWLKISDSALTRGSA